MLAKNRRFTGHKSVRYTMSRGKRVRGDGIGASFVQPNRHPNSRIAIVVSSKTSKKAVVRNRIRRRIYHYLLENWNTVPANTDLAIVIYDAKLAEVPAEEVSTRVGQLLEQIPKE